MSDNFDPTTRFHLVTLLKNFYMMVEISRRNNDITGPDDLNRIIHQTIERHEWLFKKMKEKDS